MHYLYTRHALLGECRARGLVRHAGRKPTPLPTSPAPTPNLPGLTRAAMALFIVMVVGAYFARAAPKRVAVGAFRCRLSRQGQFCHVGFGAEHWPISWPAFSSLLLGLLKFSFVRPHRCNVHKAHHERGAAWGWRQAQGVTVTAQSGGASHEARAMPD